MPRGIRLRDRGREGFVGEADAALHPLDRTEKRYLDLGARTVFSPLRNVNGASDPEELAGARERIESIEKLMLAELGSDEVRDAGWDADSLRRELGSEGSTEDD